MKAMPIRKSRSSTPPRPMSRRACANSPAARAPTSCSTRSAIPISRRRTNRWRLRGRQILIAAVDRIVQFNILEFYRGQHTYVGIDTLGLSSVATGAVLRELGPGFASGHLKPFPIKPNAIYPLEQAKAAFIAVAGSSRDRVILRPA